MSGKTFIKAYDGENFNKINSKERIQHFISVFVRFSNDKHRKKSHSDEGKFNKFSFYYAILLFC